MCVQQDHESYAMLTQKHGNRVTIVGTDLVCCSEERMEKCYSDRCVNAVGVHAGFQGSVICEMVLMLMLMLEMVVMIPMVVVGADCDGNDCHTTACMMRVISSIMIT